MHSQSLSLSQASDTTPPAPKSLRRRCRTLSISIPITGTSKITVAASISASKSAAQDAAGAFTLTRCARAALLGLVLGTSDESDSNEDSSSYDDRELHRPAHTRTSSTFSDTDVPSISRTASPFERERAPIPPGWGARPRRAGKTQRRERSQSRERSRIHPVLKELERTSRVGTGNVVCAACGTSGVNFPRCPRCAKLWCSRPCRMAAVHRCPPRRSQTMV
ncbi:hypothetical protein C8R45DRAFT_179371 [Mycena sanguinolenta]|nr:hypothetical protein C8R45DRAFT_179371 [Mycena sanguinolenta]